MASGSLPYGEERKRVVSKPELDLDYLQAYLALVVDRFGTCQIAFVVRLLQDGQGGPIAHHCAARG